jgi:hypothetical protein
MTAHSKHTKDLDHYLTEFRRESGSHQSAELPFFVFCRRRRSVLDIADCADCSYCEGIKTEGNERAYVTCRYTTHPKLEGLIPLERLSKPPTDPER